MSTVIYDVKTGGVITESNVDTEPSHSHTYPSGAWSGMLTMRGTQQAQALGSKLRTRYVEQLKLLPPHWSPDALYLRSTNVTRTLSTLKVRVHWFTVTRCGS